MFLFVSGHTSGSAGFTLAAFAALTSFTSFATTSRWFWRWCWNCHRDKGSSNSIFSVMTLKQGRQFFFLEIFGENIRKIGNKAK